MTNKVITFKLDQDTLDKVDSMAKAIKKSRAEIIRFAIGKVINNPDAESVMSALIGDIKNFHENQSKLWRVVKGMDATLKKITLESLIQGIVCREISLIRATEEQRAAILGKVVPEAERLAEKLLGK